MTATRAASALLLLLLAGLFLFLSSRWAARSRRPWCIRVAGLYLVLLHLVALAGLLSSVALENGLASLALLTFPFSMWMFDDIHMQGFTAPADLALNYLRYIVCFGGLDAVLIGGFLALVVPARRAERPRRLET